MTHREQSLALVAALFDLARAGRAPTLERVAGRTALALADTRAALVRLSAVGLVVVTPRGEPRLTLTGLALAASLAEQRARPVLRLAA